MKTSHVAATLLTSILVMQGVTGNGLIERVATLEAQVRTLANQADKAKKELSERLDQVTTERKKSRETLVPMLRAMLGALLTTHNVSDKIGDDLDRQGVDSKAVRDDTKKMMGYLRSAHTLLKRYAPPVDFKPLGIPEDG